MLRSVAFVRVVTLFLLLVAGSAVHSCFAQEIEGDLVYKFKVATAQDPVTAKPALVALLAHGDARSCHFVDEEDTFTMAMPAAITRQEIAARLASAGYLLVGPVLVSDGTVLIAPAPMVSDE